jgi:hypothetical protein
LEDIEAKNTRRRKKNEEETKCTCVYSGDKGGQNTVPDENKR